MFLSWDGLYGDVSETEHTNSGEATRHFESYRIHWYQNRLRRAFRIADKRPLLFQLCIEFWYKESEYYSSVLRWMLPGFWKLIGLFIPVNLQEDINKSLDRATLHMLQITHCTGEEEIISCRIFSLYRKLRSNHLYLRVCIQHYTYQGAQKNSTCFIFVCSYFRPC